MSPHKSKEKSGCMNYFGRFTISVVTYTEIFFYKLGLFVGKHPFRTIALCWLLVILSAFGFLRFREEKDPLKLWIPPHTTFARDTQWLMTTLHQAYRDESVLITAEDVLTPEVFQQLYDIDVQVRNARSSMNLTLQDVCFEIPKLDKGLLRMLEDNTTKVDPSTTMNAALYCSFVESMKKECYVKSALELWNFNKKKIYNLTKAEIINKINTYDKNYVFGKLKNYEDLLGGVVRNESGHIVQATAILNYWYVLVNFSSTDVGKTGNHAGTAVAASEEALDWEYIFLEIMKNASSVYNNMYYKSMRSFGDITNDVLFQDIYLLICGVGIMVIYVQLVISKYNFLEARAVLGCIGLLTIGMSFVVGSGLCALCGVSYGPVHTSLPFLLMGLGVDDMFVILACWEELTSEQKSLPLHEQIGLMLKHAGVSITITSLTDVIAFLIGASTILPCLESFCIYAAAGVLMTFIFAVTFFIACFVIDQRRLDQKRNGIIPCIVHENYVPNECSQRKISNSIFKFIYSKIILSIPGKIIVIVISIVTVGFAVESALKLEQHFNPEWFLTPESHLAVYLKNIDFYYPDNGYDAGFYMGSINYSEEITKIHKAVIKLENLNCTKDVVSWVAPFREYVMNNFQHDIFEMPLDDDRFRLFLSKFLHSSRNAKYQAYFVFDGELQCGAPTPKIKMSYVDFYFKRYKDPRDQIFPMHQVRDIAEQINFTTGDKFATSWSIYFSTWITDELIEIEVMRNLQLALLCVMLCTIILIADWQTCFWIFVMVLLTMIEVCGFMQRWGLTIDLVACIGLELAIGLCVDYSTHVGHTFLTIPNGTKQDRIIKTVTSIGAAVLYGGLSTFIGVFMLSQSSAYTFQALFKIFALVILFGLYNGIVLLPVILSLVGPQPYRVHKPVPMTELDMK